MNIVPALIGAAASIGSSAIANKASGVPGGSALTGPLVNAENLGVTNAQQLMPAGTNLLTNAANALNPVLQYYAPLLFGNAAAMTRVLAPRINQINQAYDAQRAAQEALVPRGGGLAGLKAMLPYQRLGTLLNLVQNARSGAAQGISQAAGQLGQFGSNLISGANQSLLASTSAGRTLMDYANQVAAQNRSLGSSIGQAAQDIAGKLLGGGNPLQNINTGAAASSAPLPIIFGGGSIGASAPPIPDVSPISIG